jgi:hypothetical protein
MLLGRPIDLPLHIGDGGYLGIHNNEKGREKSLNHQVKYKVAQLSIGTTFLQYLFRDITIQCDKLKGVFMYIGARPQVVETPLLLQ